MLFFFCLGAWICNRQNNLVDCAWFGLAESPFNVETEKGWDVKDAPIPFPTSTDDLKNLAKGIFKKFF